MVLTLSNGSAMSLVCQPAPSIMFLLTQGTTIASSIPLAGHTEPNKYAYSNCCCFTTLGLEPCSAQSRVVVFCWPTRSWFLLQPFKPFFKECLYPLIHTGSAYLKELSHLGSRVTIFKMGQCEQSYLHLNRFLLASKFFEINVIETVHSVIYYEEVIASIRSYF